MLFKNKQTKPLDLAKKPKKVKKNMTVLFRRGHNAVLILQNKRKPNQPMGKKKVGIMSL